MSDEIAVAFMAIKKTKGLKVTLTGMGTQVESTNLKTYFEGSRSCARSSKKSRSISHHLYNSHRSKIRQNAYIGR